MRNSAPRNDIDDISFDMGAAVESVVIVVIVVIKNYQSRTGE